MKYKIYLDIISKNYQKLNAVGLKRVLLLGLCPLPCENAIKTLGPGKRTYQFAKALIDEGHKVILIACRHPSAYSKELPEIVHNNIGELEYISVDNHLFENLAWMQGRLDEIKPDCLAAATVYPSYIASRLKRKIPLWCDVFGHTMAEAQTKSYVFKDDYYLHHYWNYEKSILENADAISVVSNPQAYAIIGELGAKGRLTFDVLGQDLVYVIPCGIDPQEEYEYHPNKVRGAIVKMDDFVVLSSGGFNTWTDVETMFYGVERAMAKNQKIKFLATGGKLEGHDELTYNHFASLVEKSPFSNRFILKEWIPAKELFTYYKDCDVGLNVDKYCYEAILGSRNRIVDWMWAGLPVITTQITELSKVIADNKIGFCFSPGNVEELCELLLKLAENKTQLYEISEKAKKFVADNFTYSLTTIPLKKWVKGINNVEKTTNTRRWVNLENSPTFKEKRHYYISSLKFYLKQRGLWQILVQGINELTGLFSKKNERQETD